MTHPYGSAWNKLRSRWTLLLPVPCTRCGQPVHAGEPWDLDHVIPLALGGGPDTARPAHQDCNRRAGIDTREQIKSAGVTALRDDGFFLNGNNRAESSLADLSPHQPRDDAVSSPGPDDPCWHVAWIAPNLLDVPRDASWPRYMSRPHPNAVGSYGAEFADFAETRSGRPLRWWQRLAATRLLEHDADGHLVWLWVLMSTARQVGKSVLLGELALWRLHQSERWAETQLALLVSKDVAASQEVHRPAQAWARAQPGWTVRLANGQQQVETPDGSRWAIRGAGSTYSYSASLAMLDEAWSLDASVAEDGIEPTIVERTSPQVLLTSTAHRAATPLFVRRRAAALLDVDEPRDVLLLEWSASSSVDLGDVNAWRAASPHWSERRRRLIASKHRAATSGSARSHDPADLDPVASFRSQWLNIWPTSSAGAVTGRDEPLLSEDVWPLLVDLSAGGPSSDVVIAVEDYFGRGAAVAVATIQSDGRAAVWGSLHESRTTAFDAVRLIASSRPGARLLIGGTLETDTQIPHDVVASVEAVGTTQTRTALPLIRDLVAHSRLVHDGGTDLAQQIQSLRVVEATSGGLTVSTRSGRTDLARAAAWAVAAVVGDRTGPLPFYVY